jgi:hypothetical protein
MPEEDAFKLKEYLMQPDQGPGDTNRNKETKAKTKK